MKSILLTIAVLGCSLTALAQSNPIDRYLTHKVESKIMADHRDSVAMPQDLDFCRIPGREHELWVLNRGEDNGGSIVILFDAGKGSQWSQYRHDSHAAHFMRNSTAIAMAPNGNFGTTQEILNTLGDSVITFMGPTLWDSDTAVFARLNQNDWVEGELLGSHSDMLHQSPYSMGISSDTANAYWVFDGYHGKIFRYDFATPHPYGHDDHSDGIVYQYQINVKRVPDLPSHMVLDEETKWLYIVDNGNNRVIRLQTRSGQLGDALTPEYEWLHEYREVDDVTWETIETGITSMSGIDVFENRMLVTVNNTGEIRVFDIGGNNPTYLGSIITGDAGIMGVKVGPDSTIWYVNKSENTVVRLTLGEPLASVQHHPDNVVCEVYPNPATTVVHFKSSVQLKEIEVVDAMGRIATKLIKPNASASLVIDDIPNGVYYVRFISEGQVTVDRFVINR